MIDNKLLDIILKNEKLSRVPIAYQSTVIRAVEETLEKNEIEVIGHDVVLKSKKEQSV